MLGKIIGSIFILVVSVGWTVAQEKSKADVPSDETAVRQIVQQLESGWNAHDGTAFAAPFSPDADYVVVDGMYVKGREAIEKGHQAIFTTVYKDSTNRATVKRVRFLRADIAIVHVEWNLVVRFGDKEEKGRAMNTMFMSKENGKWSIAAFHNTPIKDRAQ